jgi:hypothetical protein
VKTKKIESGPVARVRLDAQSTSVQVVSGLQGVLPSSRVARPCSGRRATVWRISPSSAIDVREPPQPRPSTAVTDHPPRGAMAKNPAVKRTSSRFRNRHDVGEVGSCRHAFLAAACRGRCCPRESDRRGSAGATSAGVFKSHNPPTCAASGRGSPVTVHTGCPST